VHIGQPALDAIVIKAQTLVVQAQDVQDRCVKVVYSRDVLNGLVPEFVGGAVAEAVLAPAPVIQTVKPDGL